MTVLLHPYLLGQTTVLPCLSFRQLPVSVHSHNVFAVPYKFLPERLRFAVPAVIRNSFLPTSFADWQQSVHDSPVPSLPLSDQYLLPEIFFLRKRVPILLTNQQLSSFSELMEKQAY